MGTVFSVAFRREKTRLRRLEDYGNPQEQRVIIQMASLRCGFVGLGNMGAQLANKLQGATPSLVRVWDMSADAVQQHAETYGTAPTVKLSDLGDCDVVSLCVPSLKQSREVCTTLVEDGGLASGAVIIDHTSGDPLETRALSEFLKEHGVTYLDAPVSGGPAGAAAGTLACMVGHPEGESATVDACVNAIAGKVVYLDTVGSGNAVKAVNNLLNSTHLIIASQCMEALDTYGVDVSKAIEAINGSSGRSLQTEVRIPVEVLPDRYNYGFNLGLMHKDVRQCRGFLDAVLEAGPEERPWVAMTEGLFAAHPAPETSDYTRIVEKFYKK